MPTVALDAMAGETAPEEIVRAAAEISVSTDIVAVLVGDEVRIQEQLDRLEYAPERLTVVEPAALLAPGASLEEAVRIVGGGRADALVSAGSSRACVEACGRLMPRLSGVSQPALATVLPRQTEYPGQDPLALVLDVGASAHADAGALVRFAVMGSAWARAISKVEGPRVALLGMGPRTLEDDEVLRLAADRLARDRRLTFVGLVEGADLVRGRADVIVCAGFVGRIVRTLFEGMSSVLADVALAAGEHRLRWRLGLRLVAEGIERVQALTDYGRYGGAPVLGFERVVIVCNPHSSARAITNAVKVAAKAVRDGVIDTMATAVSAPAGA